MITKEPLDGWLHSSVNWNEIAGRSRRFVRQFKRYTANEQLLIQTFVNFLRFEVNFFSSKELRRIRLGGTSTSPGPPTAEARTPGLVWLTSAARDLQADQRIFGSGFYLSDLGKKLREKLFRHKVIFYCKWTSWRGRTLRSSKRKGERHCVCKCAHSLPSFAQTAELSSLCQMPVFITALLELKGLPFFPVVEIRYINVSDVYFTNQCWRMLQRERKTSNEDKEQDGDTDSLGLMCSLFFRVCLMTRIS